MIWDAVWKHRDIRPPINHDMYTCQYPQMYQPLLRLYTVTAVRTVPRGYSYDCTLGGLVLGIQTTQSAGGGAFPEECRVKLLRTFSTVSTFS